MIRFGVAVLELGINIAVNALIGAIALATAAWCFLLTAAAAILVGTIVIAAAAITAVAVIVIRAIVIAAALLLAPIAIGAAIGKWLADMFKQRIDLAAAALKWWSKIFKDLETAVKKAVKEAEERENGIVCIINGEIRVIEKRAQGGFPATGQTFIAREAGPELVGTIRGRNAVVNNNQIVEAVSRGVYSAFKSAVFGNDINEPVKAILYLDNRQISMA